MKQFTYETGNECAIVNLANGERALISGGTKGIFFEEGQITRIYVHTHPYEYSATGPSAGDLNSLKELGQKGSYLIEHGNIEKFHHETRFVASAMKK
jgi:hypothetical protein